MKKLFVGLFVSALFVFVMAGQTYGAPNEAVFYRPAIIFEEDFEGSDDLLTYDHLYTAHANEITSEGALSGTQSLTTFVVDAPGQWVDTLSIKKDFTQIKGTNAFEVRAKVQTSNYQQLMVEVRKNYDGNTVQNMPYEFIVQFDETAKTISRPCWAGWYNACTTLNIFNEEYDINQQGVITFKFEFSSNEPVVITFRGVIKNLSEVAIMTFDDITVAEKPFATEDFEYIKGNFWEDTAFWANSGGIETDISKVISGQKSLRYDIASWTLGGITNTKVIPPRDTLVRLSFDIRSINGKQFLLATPWSPLYFEFSYNFETGQLSHPGLSTASATLEDGVLHASMEFIVPSGSPDLQSFNFYGDLLDTNLPGSYIIDNFKLEVVDKQVLFIPDYQVGYAITKSAHMKYLTNIKTSEFLSIKDEDNNIIDPSNYIVTDYEFTFKNDYLDAFEAGQGNLFTIESTFGTYSLSLDIYDVRPSVTPTTVNYNLSLNQNVVFDIDLNDEELLEVKFDDTVLETYEFVNNKLTLTRLFLQTKAVGNHMLVIKSSGGITYIPFIIVQGTAPFSTTPYTFEKGTATDFSIPHYIDLSIVEGLYLGSTLLTPTTHYTVTETHLTLKASYLNSLTPQNHEFTVKTKTSGVEFTFSVSIPMVAPTTSSMTFPYDVKDQANLIIPIELHNFNITSVNYKGTPITAWTYSEGNLTILASVFDGERLGNKTLVITTPGGSLYLTVAVSNTAAMNSVIQIAIINEALKIEKGATFNPAANVLITQEVGQTTIYTSSYHNTNVSGRYVVTIVVVDSQFNTSYASYIIEVLGSEYSVQISFNQRTVKGGAIDEAILNSNRKSRFSI